MAKHRNPVDFNAQSPPLEVRDPEAHDRVQQGIAGRDPNYPRHMVKPDLDGPGGPASRELVVAENEADAKRFAAQGYMSHQEADVAERKAKGAPATAPGPGKLTPARKPRNPKPKPVAK